MDFVKITSLIGILISMFALIVSLGVLWQMRKNTELAKIDSELRIKPIVFVRGVELIMENNDNVKGIKLSVVNAGLGPALNVSVTLQSDITIPGTGSMLSKDMFSQSNIIQVLPNTEGNVQGTMSVTVNGDKAYIDLSKAQVLPNEFITNASTAYMPVQPRPDNQVQLKLSSLKLHKWN